MTSARIAVIGDNCVDAYVSEPYGRFVGGNGVNVAVQLALAGQPADYFGAVGSDAAGTWIKKSLSGVGVGVNYLEVRSGRTSVTRVAVEGVERVFVKYDRGVGDEYVLEERIAADLALLSGYMRLHVVRLANSIVARLARQLTLPVSCDFGPDHSMSDVAGLDVAFFSAVDSEHQTAAGIARAAVDYGASAAVVTCGKAGSVAFEGQRLAHVDAVHCEVVDTLGAGDSYIAGFLSARIDGANLESCMEKGAALAARTCSHLGGWPQETISAEVLV